MTADYNTCTTCVNLKLQIVCYFNERILHVITCLHVYSLSYILLWKVKLGVCFFSVQILVLTMFQRRSAVCLQETSSVAKSRSREWGTVPACRGLNTRASNVMPRHGSTAITPRQTTPVSTGTSTTQTARQATKTHFRAESRLTTSDWRGSLYFRYG